MAFVSSRIFNGNVTDTLVHVCYEDTEPEIRKSGNSTDKRKSADKKCFEAPNHPHLLRHTSMDSGSSNDLYLSSSLISVG